MAGLVVRMGRASRRHPAALTREQVQQISDNDEMIEIAVHPAALPWLWVEFDRRGIGLVQGPSEVDGEPRWFILSPDGLCISAGLTS